MSLPSVNLTVQDGGLGLLGADTDNVHTKFGVCSSGVPNTLYGFGNKDEVCRVLGTGPLVEALCLALDQAGGPVMGVRINASVAGVPGAVAPSRSNTSPLLTVTGAPADDYALGVEMVSGGAVGAAAFSVSLDGSSWSPPVATAAAYALDQASVAGTDTGLTLGFRAGIYAPSDSWTCACTAPSYSPTDLSAALDGALADSREAAFWHILGCTRAAAGMSALAVAVEAKLDAAYNAHRYLRAILELPDVPDAAIAAAFAQTQATRVAVVPGYADVLSALSGRVLKRSAAWLVSSRAAMVPISEDLGQFDRGALGGVTRLDRDERASPGLSDARFTTLRTYAGVPGYYITDGRLLCGPTSDFRFWQLGRVMDTACRVTYVALLKFLNRSVRVNPATATKNPGGLYEADARAMERFVVGKLNAALTAYGHISAAGVRVDRANNILSTNTILADVSIVPLGYSKTINATIGFSNPAISVRG